MSRLCVRCSPRRLAWQHCFAEFHDATSLDTFLHIIAAKLVIRLTQPCHSIIRLQLISGINKGINTETVQSVTGFAAAAIKACLHLIDKFKHWFADLAYARVVHCDRCQPCAPQESDLGRCTIQAQCSPRMQQAGSQRKAKLPQHWPLQA